MTTIIKNSQSLLHIRFEGRSWDLALAQLGLANPGQEQALRTALANYLDVPESRLNQYVLEYHPNGNITVRPEAVFG
jgi:hypothetical protein